MIYIILIISILLLFIFFLYINFNVLQVSNYIIKSEKLTDEFDEYKIVHLSDLHLKEFGNNNKKLLDKVYNLQPDVIFVTGDMVYRRKDDFEIVYNLMKRLVEKYNVYYVLGNHEASLRYNKLKAFNNKLREIGVNLLLDAKATINKGGEYINVYGVNFKFNMEPKITNKIMSEKYCKIFSKQIGEVDSLKYNILLAHDPLNYELYDKFKFDLVFSGHVHGGALRIFGKGIFSPRRLFFPKYSAGVYDGKYGKLVVSRGLGSSTLKFRMFNLPEIVCVTLKNK